MAKASGFRLCLDALRHGFIGQYADFTGSPVPIATISPAPAVPPLPLAAASLNTPSFRLSPINSAHYLQTLSS
jgi:hypothetical protein